MNFFRNKLSAADRLSSDSLALGVLVLLGVTVVQRSVGLGRGILFCRWLTPEALGQWEMAYSFLLLAAPLAVLGVPGSFGRYLEHYRLRGHLWTFLRRTTAWTLLWGGLAVVVVAAFAQQFSEFIFGSPNYEALVRGLALCLAAVILHHTLTSLLTALRLFRVASLMNFAQSLLFAVLALGLLFRGGEVGSIVVGYGVACLAASAAAMVWIWPGLTNVAPPDDRLPQSEFWHRLMRFAFFVWVTNMLSHLFAIADRYMIVHFSGMDSAEALDQIGHYHSSRVVPLLLVSVADLLSGLLLPHLSHDWEAGRRRQVGIQVNLAIKLTGLGMLAFGVCVLCFSPFLFEYVLQGKYNAGLRVLPWTLVGCVWYGIYSIAQNYLWCAERTRLATVPLVLGLTLNLVLNLLLLPTWGLMGAVVATALATLCCLASVLLLNSRQRMKLDFSTWLICLAPITLAIGPATAAAELAVLVAAAAFTSSLFSSTERRLLHESLARYVHKIPRMLRPKISPANSA